MNGFSRKCETCQEHVSTSNIETMFVLRMRFIYHQMLYSSLIYLRLNRNTLMPIYVHDVKGKHHPNIVITASFLEMSIYLGEKAEIPFVLIVHVFYDTICLLAIVTSHQAWSAFEGKWIVQLTYPIRCWNPQIHICASETLINEWNNNKSHF